ncbi:APC family permease [Streptomyces sp. NPDC048002]|uniref:APC family permease n=1 Tax=Streptomyces sp. NPDC048002 TaxID=3154344 RepID=UPI0034072920
MDPSAAAPVRFGLAQDLAGHGGHLALPEEEEAEDVGEGTALGPLEVDLRGAARRVADGQEEGGQRVGDGGGLQITGVNLRGIVDSAKAFIVPTVVFVGSILVLITVGLFRAAPVSTATADGHASVLADNATTVGALLLLKAFASGCSALTRVEAIANAVPSFRVPRAKSAQHAEVALGHNWAFYVVQFATVVLLALSANTSLGGQPVLLKLLARDNYLPHVFALKADRQVHRHGVLTLAGVSAALMVFSGGDTNTLVPLFAIGVFVGFTIAQVGMVRHWRLHRGPGWEGKALLNGFGGLLTGVSAVVVTATTFEEGAWLVVVALPLLVPAFETVHRAYGRIGERLGLGQVPEAPHRERAVVIVPVSSLSRLASEALTAARSLGDEVRAVTVCHPDAEDRAALHALERAWAEWDPGVPLVRLDCARRSLGRPIAAYVREVGAVEPATRVTVLIPETEPEHVWQRLLRNPRGAVVAHAVRRETDAVICRLRFRLR